MPSDSRAPRGRGLARSVAAALAVAVLSAGADARGSLRRFFPDDPVWVDDDRVADAKGVRPFELDGNYDFIENVFGAPGDRSRIRALNVNTLDEVPDSSWFTNRIGRRQMSVAQLVKGPDRKRSFSDAWTIVRGKNRGFQPGFRAVDRNNPDGPVYQLEVDPPGHPEMATGAEVVGTAFYHAFGYNTVEVHLLEIDPAKLEIAPNATIRDANGRRRFTQADLADVLGNAARQPNGRMRVSAERLIDDDDMGRFEYHGTRADDPNDIYPHEHRRELRGSRVFAAWLNHDDSRAVNTLVVRHRDAGKRYLKYYMVDFGSLLGSATRFADGPQSGREPLLSARPSWQTLLTLGLYVRPWLRQPDPPMPPAVGRFSAEAFDPRAWVAEYPKTAYLNMRDDDAFWGARIVARFDDGAIRSIVEKGQYSDPRTVDAITEVLIRRRDRIKDVWLTAVNPVVDATLSDRGGLTFANAATAYGAAVAPEGYALTWSRFDNESDTHTQVGIETVVRDERGEAPPELLRGSEYISVRIRTVHPEFPGWTPVAVYFRRTAGGWQTVGLDRGLD